MSLIHRNLDGSWAECADEACTLLFHFPNTTVEEMSAVPPVALYRLLEAIEPPDRISRRSGKKIWGDISDKVHRDYDLPAIVEGDYANLWWYQHGDSHRDYDRPAITRADGTQLWAYRGMTHREGDKPAVIRADGTLEYWLRDERIR